MKKRPVWYLIIGITILIVPTAIYLAFLIPVLSEEYNILMASGGIIGGAGMYAGSKIPDTLKYSSMFKLASNSFTIMTVMLIVEKFLLEIMGLVAVFILCFIIFQILKGVYTNARRRKENAELAEEITRTVTKNT